LGYTRSRVLDVQERVHNGDHAHGNNLADTHDDIHRDTHVDKYYDAYGESDGDGAFKMRC
jgi:hypothetical protein